MTPIKAGVGNGKKGFFTGTGADTGTVSGMMISADGEDYEYHLNSERDEDNMT